MNQRVCRLIHLPGRCPVNFDTSSFCFFRNPAIEVCQSSVEQRLHVSLLRAMRVELQENIIAYGRCEIEPAAHTRLSRHIIPGKLTSFCAWNQSAAEAQTKRT